MLHARTLQAILNVADKECCDMKEEITRLTNELTVSHPCYDEGQVNLDWTEGCDDTAFQAQANVKLMMSKFGPNT
jgi:hypothetical protein